MRNRARPRLLDLFCGAGGCSEGYRRAGFDVVGVDLKPQRHYRGGTFVQADALEYVREHGHEFDAIHASPPCQAHSSLRALQKGKEYADLIPATREALVATGKPYVIENVVGAPLGGGSSYLLLLCGTMFGLVTPDGRAEIRRHRLFETNWCFGLRPTCQHGGPAIGVVTVTRGGINSANTPRRETITVAGHYYHNPAERSRQRLRCAHCGHDAKTHGTDAELLVSGDRETACGKCSCAGFVSRRAVLCVAGSSPHNPQIRQQLQRARDQRRAMSVTGNTPQTNVVRNVVRETFSVDDARAAMGIDWMPMKSLSQAIPPAYTAWIGARLLEHLASDRVGIASPVLGLDQHAAAPARE